MYHQQELVAKVDKQKKNFWQMLKTAKHKRFVVVVFLQNYQQNETLGKFHSQSMTTNFSNSRNHYKKDPFEKQIFPTVV